MIAVKGYFDGEKVHLLESVPVPVQPSEVTVWFSEDAAQKKAKSTQAKKKLRALQKDFASGKSWSLTGSLNTIDRK